MSTPTTTLASLTKTVASTGSVLINDTAAATNATASSTILVIPALTTPFELPSQCTPVQQWTPATVSVTFGESRFNATYSHVFLPVTGAEYSSCLPPGWDSIATEYRFSYSNAVCPGGYNYNQLSDIFHDQTNAETIPTTAFCCPGGFTYRMFYDKDVLSLSGANCVRMTPMTALAYPSNSTASATLLARNESTPASITATATMLYQPWNIIWQKRDTTALSPTPPVVSVQSPVSTWEPGTEVDPSLRRVATNPNALNQGLGRIIGIVVGCVAVAFLATLAISVYFCLRSRRRRREEFEREEHQLQEQRLERIGEYQRSRSPTDDEPLPVYVASKNQDKAMVETTRVPPYKERPSSESSRHSGDHGQPYTNRGNIREDGDDQALHDGHSTKTATVQHGT